MLKAQCLLNDIKEPRLNKIIRNKELAKILSERSGNSYWPYEILDFLELFPRVIEELVLEGNEVRWTNFGSFKPKYSNPKVIKSKLQSGHKGIATLHGASYEIPPGMTMKFTVSETFQRDLKGKYMQINKESGNFAESKEDRSIRGQ